MRPRERRLSVRRGANTATSWVVARYDPEFFEYGDSGQERTRRNRRGSDPQVDRYRVNDLDVDGVEPGQPGSTYSSVFTGSAQLCTGFPKGHLEPLRKVGI
jgi:hypothetical protein